MKTLIAGTAILALAACAEAEAPADEVATTADAVVEEAVASPAAYLAETTWTYEGDDGEMKKQSIDADGNYITDKMDGSHDDHGTVVVSDGQACFDSAMDEEGPKCWSDQEVGVGESFDAVAADDGEVLTVTRVEYEPLAMPGA